MSVPAHDSKISVVSLVKSFGDNVVLRGLSLELDAGESLVVVGGSGAGKTVFLKHLIGLLQPDEGRVIVNGIDLAEASPSAALELRKSCGMSFQEGALFDSMTVFDNIAFPLRRHSRRSKADIAARVRTCLDLVHLDGVEDRFPAELSGGMRRRVGFARAIALEPEILLFDEPTTGLDPVNTAAIAAVINDLRRDLDVTAVTITHDMKVAFQVADRIAMLRQGRLLAVEPPEVFARLEHPYIRAFLDGTVLSEEEEEIP